MQRRDVQELTTSAAFHAGANDAAVPADALPPRVLRCMPDGVAGAAEHMPHVQGGGAPSWDAAV